MEAYFHGANTKYDDTYFSTLLTCMGKYDDDLLVKAQDIAWKKGFIDYYQDSGVWGHQHTPFIEGLEGANVVKMGGIDIYEPCNYVSNVAFYNDVTRICDFGAWNIQDEYIVEFKRSFANLASGSAHMHGSHTALGAVYDTRFIAIIFYLIQ